MKTVILSLLLVSFSTAHARPTIEELKARAVLDDYESSVVFGYNIVMETNRYAARYAGNGLSCTSCHLKGGTQLDGFPLNVAGVYPKWRSKNGVRNGIGLRIRDCFLYSLNGVMPPEEAAEVQAVASYINYLSEGEVIGQPPKGAGVPTLPETGADPNPPRGQVVYKRECAICHGLNGQGGGPIPPVWGPELVQRRRGAQQCPAARWVHLGEYAEGQRAQPHSSGSVGCRCLSEPAAPTLRSPRWAPEKTDGEDLPGLFRDERED